MALILVAALVGAGTTGLVGASPAGKSEPAPTVMVAGPILKLDKKAQVVIMEEPVLSRDKRSASLSPMCMGSAPTSVLLSTWNLWPTT